MKVSCCSVCQNRYNKEDRVPLLLQCGHGFCKECLSRMFAASLDTTLPCPRCRHVSTVGNSVSALRKNFPILSLLQNNSSLDADITSSSDSDDDDHDVEDADARRKRVGNGMSLSSAGGAVGDDELIELGQSNLELKLVRKIGEGRRAGVEVWEGAAVGGGGGGTRKWRRAVAVKKVVVAAGEEMEWVVGKAEELRRKAMWCRNVCGFHGVLVRKNSRNCEEDKEDGGECLWLVWEKCDGSVMSEMQRNEGRLTLEQILRSLFVLQDLVSGLSLCFFLASASYFIGRKQM